MNMNRKGLFVALARFIPQIENHPNEIITSYWLRKIGAIDLGASATRWALTLDLPIVRTERCGRGQRIHFRKADLLNIFRTPPLDLQPCAPQQARAPAGLAALLDRFQRDFAATMDALHQDLVARADQSRPRLEAIATLAEAAVNLARQTAERLEQIDKPLEEISAYFERQQEVNRLLFRQIEAANQGIAHLNQELGVHG